jgi:hypothetical protein
MAPTPEQANEAIRFLFDQPVAQVMILGWIVITVLLLLVVVMLIRMVMRFASGANEEQRATLNIVASLVAVTERLTNRVESLAANVAMSNEQTASLALIVASVNDNFGRFRSGLTRWVKADYSTKQQQVKTLDGIKAQVALLNEQISRIDAQTSTRKPLINLNERNKR